MTIHCDDEVYSYSYNEETKVFGYILLILVMIFLMYTQYLIPYGIVKPKESIFSMTMLHKFCKYITLLICKY